MTRQSERQSLFSRHQLHDQRFVRHHDQGLELCLRGPLVVSHSGALLSLPLPLLLPLLLPLVPETEL